jgi:hypothetical protein
VRPSPCRNRLHSTGKAGKINAAEWNFFVDGGLRVVGQFSRDVDGQHMSLDVELWRQHQYQMLVSFVHHLGYYRVLHRFYRDTQVRSEFWLRTTDAHLLRAIIDWCMVFGTDSNQIHWKQVVTDGIDRRDFRNHLLAAASLTQDDWDNYWVEMTTFRNEYAAHRVAGNYPVTPKMDTALLVATTYDLWIRERLREYSNATFDEPSVKERYDRVIRTSEKFLKTLVALGPTFEQEYEGNPPGIT